jgi:eukaryotic-like serine/threonine-protein kinase
MPEWKVPGYTELRELGSGGFGEVMLARHDQTGMLVAIKYLRHEFLTDTGFAGMFRSEAEVLGSLDDPNVVRLYEYVESPSGAAIVMELINGVSLRQILTNQGSTTAEAALVVLQGSLMGLAAAHRRGVVHRDYKPENVLVSGDGVSKLTDFGLAARTGEHPIPAGTLRYVAPEQIAGGPASPASDVYSATATFYECLTGRPPFSGQSAELLRQHSSEPVPLDPLPEPLRPLMAAGMAKDPAQRPADATTFVTELKTVAASAYGQDWEERGRSHLGEAALLLAALWPSGAPPAVQGTAVHRISLFRHVSPIRAAIATGVVVAGVAAGTALAANRSPSQSSQPSSHHVAVQPTPTTPTPTTPTPTTPTPTTPTPTTPTPTTPTPTTPTPTLVGTVTITIPANAGFVDTGISLSQGESVTITASGQWTPDGGDYTGPDGFDSSSMSADNYLNVADLGACASCASTDYPEWAALMSYTGDAPPTPGSYASNSAVSQTDLIDFVGSSLQGAWPDQGELWLGMNDDAYSGNTSDNYGSVTVTITTG